MLMEEAMKSRGSYYRSRSYYRDQPDRRHKNWLYMQFQKPLNNRVWVPAVPTWEKQFCLQVGSLEWKKFLELKRYSRLYPKIEQWDDSAGKQAFDNAKKIFYCKLKGLPCNLVEPSLDLYIDKVDSADPVNDCDIYSELNIPVDELIGKLDDEDEDDGAEDPYYAIPAWPTNPTGWEDDCIGEATEGANNLVGMIVGDK